MPDKFRNGLLPMQCPTQKRLRAAVANIIRDIQRDHNETDQDTADNLGISDGTVFRKIKPDADPCEEEFTVLIKRMKPAKAPEVAA